MFISSGALDELSAINRQVLVVIVFQIRAHSPQVPCSFQMNTCDLHLLLAFLRSVGECTEGPYQEDDYGQLIPAIIYFQSISQVLRIDQL